MRNIIRTVNTTGEPRGNLSVVHCKDTRRSMADIEALRNSAKFIYPYAIVSGGILSSRLVEELRKYLLQRALVFET